MSGFSRSLKSPSYLSSQYLSRPTMGSRTFSNSSERSHNSDDGSDRPTHSGRTTPQAYQTRRYHPPQTAPAATNQSSAPGATDFMGPMSVRDSTASQFSASSSHSSSPIAIELPPANKKIGSAPVYTPPEPLSARGDLPGGYFPNHEDPKSRVQRTHPFHSEKKTARTSNPTLDQVGSYREQRSLPRHHTTSSTMSAANAPVSSYFPSGYHDNPIPMGKYYPTNYERTHGQRAASGTPSSPADARSPGSFGPTGGAQQDHGQHAQLQQYKREMMAQASRAATEVMGASQSKGSPKMGGLGLKGFPGLGGQVMNKPNAPRLHPLGSPGPVTPMELESSGTSASGSAPGGSYLDKGNGGSRRLS